MDTITCPLCATEGWPSSRLIAAYAAHCGTAWSSDGYVNQSRACHEIQTLRFDLALLRMQTGAAA
jgi:hypothetical protein